MNFLCTQYIKQQKYNQQPTACGERSQTFTVPLFARQERMRWKKQQEFYSVRFLCATAQEWIYTGHRNP